MTPPPLSRFATSLAVALLLAVTAPPASADEPHLAEDFELTEIPGNWSRPVVLVFAPDGSLFVGEKPGRIRVHDGTSAQTTPFLTIYDEVNSRDDRGLLGLALHPGFVPDGGATSWVYVAYTATPILGVNALYNQDQKYSWSILARWKAITNGQSEIVADLASKQVLLGERLVDGTAPDAMASLRDSHSNGSLIFGDDGSLMISCGDGAYFVGLDVGGVDDPGFDDFIHPVTGLRGQIPKDQDSGAFRAQDLRSLAGKVLRIDPETGLGLPSNPFYDGNPASLRSRVWSLGLRNAYRMAHLPGLGSGDPSLGDPGLFVVSDVGSQFYEELNLVDGPALNFQWPCVEGANPQNLYSVYNRPTSNPFAYMDCGDPQVGVQAPPILAWTRFNPSALFPPATPSFDHHGAPDGGFGGSAAVAGDFYTGGANYPNDYDGRLFVADYGDDWIRTLEFDQNFAVTAVHEFATDFDNVVDLERHSVTGEIYIVQLLDADGSNGHIWRVRYGDDGSPSADLALGFTPSSAPLLVTLDASGSSDPQGGPLVYTFDPGDGSTPVTTSADTIQHTYTVDGTYVASVTVEDVDTLTDTDAVEILVGVSPPLVEITSPDQGYELLTPGDVLVTGSGTDVDGFGPVTLDWSLFLHHNGHTHPSSTGAGATFLAQLGDHGTYGDLVYHELLLTGTTVGNTTSFARLWVYDERQVVDATGDATFISRLDELVPPVSQGTGNPDHEVLRDLIEVPATAPALGQFTTSHGGDQGTDDWLGWELGTAPGPYDRIVGVDLTSGQINTTGGWFETLVVEVRENGSWTPVEDFDCDPPYPVGQIAPYLTSFTGYAMRFAPTEGDAVRVRGVPGGTIGFVSASELRVLTIAPNPLNGARDVTDEGSIIARVDELVPPGSLGKGNPNIALVHDGTEPNPGSASSMAQFASFHNGAQGSVDYYGYVFDQPYTFSALHFREGLHYFDGGWFEDMTVEVRMRSTDPWTQVTTQQISPPLQAPGIGTLSYEAFDLTFDPVIGRQIRLVGTPGGSSAFTTISELRVLARANDPVVCPLETYGLGWPGNELELSTGTPGRLGGPFALQVSNCVPSTLGWLAMSGAAADIDLGADQRALVDPVAGFTLYPFSVDAAGTGIRKIGVPNNPNFAGVVLYFQAIAFDPLSPLLDLSNGLRIGLCP
jgi:glucose/arabinose dehydrogenase